jgi:K+-sensing histidine kinase KdpD
MAVSVRPVRSVPALADGAWRLALALAAGVLAVRATMLFAPPVGRALFVACYATVALTAWVAGGRAALLAGVVAVLGVNYYVVPPGGAFLPADRNDRIALVAVLAVVAFLSRVTGALRGARDGAQQAAAELDAANRLLREQAAALARTNGQLEEQAAELERANRQLQDQAVEMELTNEELAASAEELEERGAAAEAARVEAEAARVEAETARAEAEAANRAKAEFLA